MTSKFSREYVAHLRSEAWKARRKQTIENNPEAACYCCAVRHHPRKSPLDLHHLTYKRIGNEAPSDVVPVCRKCHVIIHDISKRGGSSVFNATEAVRGLLSRKVAWQNRPTEDRLMPSPLHLKPRDGVISRVIHPGYQKFPPTQDAIEKSKRIKEHERHRASIAPKSAATGWR